ncbi:hypothetical protein C8F01DRAFT_500364 [Mycena amicta]|nr:hypothetical protein C8F01DRAFT_500364 [Mycena amicta]
MPLVAAGKEFPVLLVQLVLTAGTDTTLAPDLTPQAISSFVSHHAPWRGRGIPTLEPTSRLNKRSLFSGTEPSNREPVVLRVNEHQR